MDYTKDKGFYDLEPRQQQARRIATLDEIATQFGNIARDVIKSVYDWRNMSPAMMWQAAKIRDWNAQR